VHLEEAGLLADLRLCAALAPPLSGTKNPGRCHALANIAGVAAGVRSNCQLCYTSRNGRWSGLRLFGHQFAGRPAVVEPPESATGKPASDEPAGTPAPAEQLPNGSHP
jgi:hypothetical protein